MMKEQEIIDRLLAAAEHNEPVKFTPEEQEVLKRLAQTLLGFEAFGRAANVIRQIVIFLLWCIGGFVAAKFGFVTWLRAQLS